MTIHYEVTEKDYINFNLYHVNHMTLGVLLKWLFCIGIPALLLYKSIQYRLIQHGSIDALYVIILIALLLLPVLGLYFLYSFCFKFAIKATIRSGKQNDFLGEQELTLHADYIEDGNAGMSSKIAYSLVERVCWDKKACSLYIYIGALKAIILPGSAFTHEAEKTEFLKRLAEKTNAPIV